MFEAWSILFFSLVIPTLKPAEEKEEKEARKERRKRKYIISKIQTLEGDFLENGEGEKYFLINSSFLPRGTSLS